MFYRKKIKDLEDRVFNRFKILNNRIAVLEFKLKAKNEKYIVTPIPILKRIQIEFLSADESKVITERFADKWLEVKQNGEYLEFWSMSWTISRYLDKVMYVSDDTLVSMDVDVYKKAFYPPNKATEPIVKVGVESKKATDALDAITDTVRTVKEKITPNENQD